MTDDLVQRLRSDARTLGVMYAAGLLVREVDQQRLRRSAKDVHEAADALEQLQAWKSEATEVIDGWKRAWVVAGRPGALGQSKSYALADEVERLQADNQRLRGELALMQNWRNVDVETFHAQTAEIMRLQQALRDLADVVSDTHRWREMKDTVAAARVVLEGNQQ